MAHQRCADAGDLARDGLVVGHAIEHRGWQAVRRCHHRRQFPVAEMRREAQRGFPVVLQLDETVLVVGYDAAGVGMRRVIVPQPAEMHVFAGDTAEIVPGAAQGRLDPGGVFFRERGAKVGAADAMRRGQRADAPRHRAAPVRGAVGIGTRGAPPACTSTRRPSSRSA